MNHKFGITSQRITLLIFAVIFFSIYTIQAVLNHYFLRTYALDYGFYNQAFWDFAHFRINQNTVFEPVLSSYFQVHPAFVLPLLSPLYWVFTPIFGTYSLLIIQNILILLGGYGTYLFIQRKTGNFLISLLAFIHYNLLWGHFSAIASDYIDVTVASAMVPFFLLFFDKKRYWLAVPFFLFTLISRENMPIWFIFISLSLVLLYKERKAKIMAASFGILSMIYFILLFKFVIPGFEKPGLPYWGFAYSALGHSPGQVLIHIVSHPWETLKILFVNHTGDPTNDGIKKEFYVVFLLSGGILLFLRPVYLLWFIPLIAQKMLNDFFARWGITGFYSVEVVSVITLAAFMSASWIKLNRVKYILFGLLCFSTAGITVLKMEYRLSKWYDPAKENLTVSTFYHTQNDVKKIMSEILSKVPEDANVAAMQDIVPHLAFRKNISIFPYVRNADYIIFLLNGNKYPLLETTFEPEKAKYAGNPEWTVITDDYPLLILKRKTTQ
jgi:uncharacterized membrane protein